MHISLCCGFLKFSLGEVNVSETNRDDNEYNYIYGQNGKQDYEQTVYCNYLSLRIMWLPE